MQPIRQALPASGPTPEPISIEYFCSSSERTPASSLPDGRSSMLYSLSAMTSYGHEHFDLANHWQLMGALEALNGMILFGLTTAFLYGMIRELLAYRSEIAAAR